MQTKRQQAYQVQIQRIEKELRRALQELRRMRKPVDYQEREQLKKRIKKLVETLKDVKFRAAIR